MISITEKDKPFIIALSETKPKRQHDFSITEHNIPCYALFVNHKIKRWVAIYAHVRLNAQLLNTLSNSSFEESIWYRFNTLINTSLIGMYLLKS